MLLKPDPFFERLARYLVYKRDRALQDMPRTCTVKEQHDPRMTNAERKLSPEERLCKCGVTSKVIIAKNAGLTEVPECVSKFTKLEKIDLSQNVDYWGRGKRSDDTIKFEASLKNLEPLLNNGTLKDVRVRGNGLTTMKPLMGRKIEVLDVGDNRLGWVDNDDNGIRHLGYIDNSIKELYMDHNDLDSIDTDWDWGFDTMFKELEVLDLSHNRLHAFSGRMAPSFDKEKIRVIDLSGNCGILPMIHTNNVNGDDLGKVLRADMKTCQEAAPERIYPEPRA